MKTSELLARAREYVSRPGVWKKYGQYTTDGVADVLDAILTVPEPEVWDDAVDALRECLSGTSIICFNDCKFSSLQDIKALFDRAIVSTKLREQTTDVQSTTTRSSRWLNVSIP